MHIRLCWVFSIALQIHFLPFSNQWGALEPGLYRPCLQSSVPFGFWLAWLMGGTSKRWEGGRYVRSGCILLALFLLVVVATGRCYHSAWCGVSIWPLFCFLTLQAEGYLFVLCHLLLVFLNPFLSFSHTLKTAPLLKSPWILSMSVPSVSCKVPDSCGCE